MVGGRAGAAVPSAAMARTEVLVRHAMALPEEGTPPREWSLGPEGRAAADELARRARLGPVAAIVTSPEPKALATAEALAAHAGRPVRVDARLAEARRPWVGEGYRAVVHRYVAGEELEGWEPHAEVAGRVAAAIAEVDEGPGEVVVVSHGLALALHLEAVLPSGFDAFGFWCRLAFPDAWRLDGAALTLSRVTCRADARTA